MPGTRGRRGIFWRCRTWGKSSYLCFLLSSSGRCVSPLVMLWTSSYQTAFWSVRLLNGKKICPNVTPSKRYTAQAYAWQIDKVARKVLKYSAWWGGVCILQDLKRGMLFAEQWIKARILNAHISKVRSIASTLQHWCAVVSPQNLFSQPNFSCPVLTQLQSLFFQIGLRVYLAFEDFHRLLGKKKSICVIIELNHLKHISSNMW